MSSDSVSVKQLLEIFNRFLKSHYWSLAGLILLNTTAGVLLGLRPLLLAPILGQVLPGSATPATGLSDLSLNNIGASILSWMGASDGSMGKVFLICATGYLILTIIIALLNTIASFSSVSIRMNVLGRMISHLHKHLMNLSFSYFVSRKMGNMASRFTQDLVVSARTMEIVVRGCVQSFVQILVYMFVLFRTDALLSGAILLMGSLHMLVTRVMGAWNKQLAVKAFDAIAALTGALQESFFGIRIIKTFAIERHESGRVNKVSESMQRNLSRYQKARFLEIPVRFIIDGLVAVVVICVSYFALTNDRLNVGGAAMFFYMANQMIMPISELSGNVLYLFNIQGTMSRIVQCLNTKPEIKDGSLQIGEFSDSIEFKNVGFAYNAENDSVLKDICLNIPRGKIVAVVGPSGSGKSTFLDLVLRLYEPTSGSILIDGINIIDYQPKSYRSLFGVVSQECILFNGTILNNIVLGRPLDDKSLRKSFQMANIDQFIESLPEKYSTQVGDRGIRLSGGQRQRIAIARALYGKPKILVFDEATSSLDSESEKEVQDAIENALQGVTGIIVAHRLSTIMHADKVIVLNNGMIEAEGMHQELLASSSTYKRLYNIQFGLHPEHEHEIVDEVKKENVEIPFDIS